MIKPFLIAIPLLLIIGLVVLVSYDEMTYVEDLIEECKLHGYDGIRFEQVNFFNQEPVCANFTIEEKFKARVKG